MEPTRRTPAEIIENPLIDHSSWHFFQAVSWLDLAKRTQKPSLLHYAAFELRYGIEYLLFELLVLANHGLTEAQYQKCLGSPAAMKKMLRSNGEHYERLASFTQILLRLDGHETLNLRYWKLDELFEYWGKASELLHFVGAHTRTYSDLSWFVRSLARLESVLEKVWRPSISTHGFGLMRPDTMEPEVRQAWEEYRQRTLSEDDLKIRMRLIQPILRERSRLRR
jgi:hypothetical protein